MDFIRQTLAQNFTGGNTTTPDSPFTHDDVPDQSGKVAVITGGSEGIGYGVSYTLLAKNLSKLFILSPNKDVIDGATAAISEELGEETSKRVKWLQCDLADWSRVVEVAKEISDSTDRLDILVLNAARGIMTEQRVHGVDRHMAVNHFGHVVLTSHLLPLLKKTADAGHTVRISSQSSNVHQSAPKDQQFKSLDDLNKEIGPNASYGRAKLANLLYARYLARHLSPQHPGKLLANATHPGIVKTKMSDYDIHEPFPLGGYGMSVGLAPLKKDQFEGALTTLYATTKTENTGEYITPPSKVDSGNELAQSEVLQEDLMKLTKELLKEKGGLDLEFY